MQTEQIKERLQEAQEIFDVISKTRESSINELKDAKEDLRSLRVISEVEKYLKSLSQDINRADETLRLKVAFEGIQKLIEICSAESKKLQNRVISLEERTKVLDGVSDFIKGRSSSYSGRLEAIDRVVSGDTDLRHPEKISVLREAERIKKQKKGDNS